VTVALSIVVMSALLASPFINVLAGRGGPRWLGSYAVVGAFGFAAAAIAVAVTIGLFKSIGPQRTRVVAPDSGGGGRRSLHDRVTGECDPVLWDTFAR